MHTNKQDLKVLIDSLPEGVDLSAVEFEVKKLLPANPTMRINFGNGHFDRDFTKEGFELKSDVESLSGDLDLDAAPFLKEDETSINSKEMIKRAVKLGANLGQRDAERLLKDPSKIPEGLRSFYLVFPGTIWVRLSDGSHCTPCLFWDGVRWVVILLWLGYVWNSRGRLLVPRKK